MYLFIFVQFHNNYALFLADTSRIWDNPFDGMIRLINGNYTNEGLLEVYCNGEWGTVCDDFFGLSGARAACKQLGYQDYSNFNHLTEL